MMHAQDRKITTAKLESEVKPLTVVSNSRAPSCDYFEQQITDYSDLGWRMLPVHGYHEGKCTCGMLVCKAAGKHPRISKWKGQATTDVATVLDWRKKWPTMNLAIATGTASNLLVLDIDPRNGGSASLAALEKHHGPLREHTLVSNTGGGGLHLFYQYPEGYDIKNNTSGILGTGIDIKSSGGYVIAPPSMHHSGTHYTWPEGVFGPSELPTELLDRLLSTSPTLNVPTGVTIFEGTRNDTLFKQACSLRGKGFEEDAILNELININATQCKPPLEADELQFIANSAAKYQAGYNGFVNRWRSVVAGMTGPDKPTTRQVLNALSNYADSEGVAFPSIQTLSADTRRNSSTVRLHLKLAEEQGWLTRVKAPNEGSQGWHYIYHLELPKSTTL